MVDGVVVRKSGDVMKAGKFTLAATGLSVDGEPTFEEWQEVGVFLQRSAGAVQWWVGDWLNYGEKRYGETYAQAVEATGLDEQTLMNFKWVANKFQFSARKENLTFGHHVQVAGLHSEQAHAILSRAESEGLSTRDVRSLARQAKSGVPISRPDDDDPCCTVADLDKLITKEMKFGCIYADPPWQYGNQTTRAATDNHYPTMSHEELLALPVGELAAERSHLHLWTTNAFLMPAMELLKAWGFEFKSTFIWVKPQLGIGNYWRCSHEIMLLGVKGGLTFPPSNIMSWVEEPRTEHSVKPDKVRGLIETVSPGPRLELFGRSMAPGWVVWGNQIQRGLFDKDVQAIG